MCRESLAVLPSPSTMSLRHRHSAQSGCAEWQKPAPHSHFSSSSYQLFVAATEYCYRRFLSLVTSFWPRINNQLTTALSVWSRFVSSRLRRRESATLAVSSRQTRGSGCRMRVKVYWFTVVVVGCRGRTSKPLVNH